MGIPIARPLLGEAEAAAVSATLHSGWVTQGPQVAQFEQEFADYVGAEHACAVSNCTTALHLALLAAGVGRGDEVITVSHSFIATANSVRYCGAIPIFVDIEPQTYNIDPDLIERAITPQTRAILVVHQMGMPCDLATILPIGRRHGLPVVEDAACAIGSEILWNGEWQKIGRPHGDIACFSFHPRKVITTGDGGMITTANAAWDAQFRLWRQHGMSVPDTVRHNATEIVFESYDQLGYNYRLTDIQAAVGREQLKRLPGFVEHRRALGMQYRELLSDIPGLQLPYEPAWARTNWQSYCIRLPDRVDQIAVMTTMRAAEISTKRGIMCAHREPAYAVEPWGCGHDSCNCTAGSCIHLRESELAQDRALILPLYPQMTLEDVQTVAETLRQACSTAVPAVKEG